MSDEELADLINEKHRLKWRIRELTRGIQEIQSILDKIDAIDKKIHSQL
jgi:succinate dehydrogenase flavin-adding protein (antitoxin of CptAB toxin-antitoxin module)